MPPTRRANRGPGAAADNRRALLAAAREVFADGGINAPLSAIAKKAGVGQGSLYRHFPDRTSLAVAVFEDNVAAFEALVADRASTLDDLLTLITDRIAESAAFVEIVSPTVEDARLVAIAERVQATIAKALRRDRRSGAVGRNVRAHDIMLAVSMVATLMAKTPADQRRTRANRAWSLLRRALFTPEP